MNLLRKMFLIVLRASIVLLVFGSTANGQVPGQPANSYVSGSNWYCVDGYQKVGNQCLSIFRGIGGQPANSYVSGSNWYCVDGYQKVGNSCVSIFASSSSSGSTKATSSSPSSSSVVTPACAENGSCYGDISENTGRPKTIHVEGYYRKDGTYVRGHYRSKPR